MVKKTEPKPPHSSLITHHSPFLKPLDQFKRPLRDLRISVTDRCNLRCQYCMPAEIFGEGFKFLPRNEVLSFEEIARLTHAFGTLGVDKVRITGGEPLLRRDIVDLVRQIRVSLPGADLAMTTNATRLEPLLPALKAAGLDRLNISLDATTTEGASKMAGREIDPAHTWQAARAAQAAGFPVKINSVIRRGVNEGEILPLARAARDAELTLRYIEFMDVGTKNAWDLKDVVPCREILEILTTDFDLQPIDPNYTGEVAKRYRDTKSGAELGFITSISTPFCSSCNRARISADGTLYTCLFAAKGTNLKTWLRDEKLSNSELEQRLTAIWTQRKDRYSEERTQETTAAEKPEMWAIGG